MAGRGQVSWLPGWWAAPSRGIGVTPSGRRAWRLRLPFPVTVAGPRRFHTGLPLTTDRMYAASLYAEQGAEDEHDRGARGHPHGWAEARPMRVGLGQ